jgi:hypothetical protein
MIKKLENDINGCYATMIAVRKKETALKMHL